MTFATEEPRTSVKNATLCRLRWKTVLMMVVVVRSNALSGSNELSDVLCETHSQVHVHGSIRSMKSHDVDDL